MITENLSTLKIHKLTKTQYERELANDTLDPNALYLTPDEGHTHEISEITNLQSSLDSVLNESKSYTDSQRLAYVEPGKVFTYDGGADAEFKVLGGFRTVVLSKDVFDLTKVEKIKCVLVNNGMELEFAKSELTLVDEGEGFKSLQATYGNYTLPAVFAHELGGLCGYAQEGIGYLSYIEFDETVHPIDPKYLSEVFIGLSEALLLKNVAAALPTNAFWHSVTYGDGKFVAVAYNSDKAAYSTDGINWTETTLPRSAVWRSVTYGDGKFVAVAFDSDKAAYSTDGINWTETTMLSYAYWHSVTYGDGKFVAVAYGANAAYSTDGINWTEATLPSSVDWQSVTYGNGKFVVVNNYDKAAYSTDGITWTETTLPSSANWQSVTYGDGKFVAVADGHNKAAYSTDGITWTETTLPSSASWSSVTYGDGKFVAVAYSSFATAYSTDGITWTETTLPSSAYWQSVTYGDGKFVAVAFSSDKAAYSTDGINWKDELTVLVTPDGTDKTESTLEVLGAVTEDIVNAQIEAHNTSASAHADIRENLNDILNESKSYTDSQRLAYVEQEAEVVLDVDLIDQAYESPEKCNLVEGHTYSVTVSMGDASGTFEDQVCKHFAMNGTEVWYLGNGSLIGQGDTGEYYFVGTAIEGTIKMTMAITTLYVDHIKVESHEMVHPIDPKYLPEGGVGYTEIVKNIVVEETSLTPVEGQESIFIIGDPIELTVNENYTVKWNGMEYSCVANEFEAGIYLGNPSGVRGDDNGMPFAVVVADMTGCFALDGSTNCTIEIYTKTEIDHCVDSRYIPELADLGLSEALLLKNVAAALPSSANWYSVTYGDGKFVTVAYNSTKAAYSTDGITWTEATLPSSAYWQSVTYGDGKFVAVANTSDKAAYSADGINWTEATLPSSAPWWSVTYGDGKFVAVASQSNKAAYSADGINWAEATLPSSAQWLSVTYGDGKFVAVNSSSDKAAYSTDGINWTEATLPSSADWRSVTHGDGKFVAVASQSNKAAYSADGINWTEATLPSSAYWRSVTHGDGKFVAVAYDSTKAAYSTDGITWAKATLPSSAPWWSVTYGDGKFVAVAYDSDKAAYSTDGINWKDEFAGLITPDGVDKTESTRNTLGLSEALLLKNVAAALPTNALWQSVTYGDGKFVAVANSSNEAAYSADGITWTDTTLPSSAQWQSVTHGDGKFVAVAYKSTKAAYSTDGINWTETTLPSSANWKSVTYGDGKFVVVVDGSDKAAYSTDGITWTETTLPSSAYWRSVTYGDGKFVAVAYSSNKAAYSADGITWADTTLPSSTQWQSVTHGDGKFVAVAYDSTKAAYSADGINWTEATLPSSAPWWSVTYGDGKFVAVAYKSTKAAYSADGITWTETTLPSSAYWRSVTYGDGKFVAVAYSSNKAAYSTDGITWEDGITFLVTPDGVDKTESTLEVLGAVTEDKMNAAIAAISVPDMSSKQDKITGTAGDFVVIGADGNVTTKTIARAEEATY